MASKQVKAKRDPVANYRKFTMNRTDMSAEQKREAVQHYQARAKVRSQEARS